MARNTFTLSLYTYEDISNAAYAEKLVSICKDIGLRWEKIGTHEPLRAIYTDDLFYQYWATSKRAGISAESMTLYSNIFCSQGRGSITLSAGWKISNPQKYSAINFHISRKVLSTRMAEFEKMFFYLIEIIKPDYAAICNWHFWLNSRGTYFQKIPLYQDIHWITYFSSNRLQEMNCSIDELSWNKRTDLPQGTVCYMCDYIPKDGDPIEAKCLEYRSLLWGVNV